MKATVTASNLNVRIGPGTSFGILGQLAKGTTVEILAIDKDWAEITFHNSSAYVSKIYLEIDAQASGKKDKTPLANGNSSVQIIALQPTRKLKVAGTSAQKKVIRSWNQFGGLLENLSNDKHIDTACSVAVLCVESSGAGFSKSNANRMTIRFENHKFWKYWGKDAPEVFEKHFTYNLNKVWTGHKWRPAPNHDWSAFHGNQAKEWQVFEFARSLNSEAAMLSISMGAPQIMGFNYQRLGYPSVEEMFNSFSADISAQIRGLFDFFSSTMVQQLQQLDFEGFAAGYNGSGQKKEYGERIAYHYRLFKECWA